MNSRVINIILPIIAIIIYICINFVYIFFAKDRYAPVIENIQKGDKMQLDFIATGVCYAILGLGWYFIGVTLALAYFDKLKQRSPTWSPLVSSALSGLVGGVVYGLVLFGVHNASLRSLFSNRYPLDLVLQDIAWGALYNMVFTSVYMIIWRKLTNPVDL
ncbi:unnamed protein product [Adineta steineri]|uniref:Uncharacterized protein n=1 Tax=Adineta steineri TaxID=433720 RepID=A0A815FG66_9BILA|nr:unnamed protein product [Adineta steineri]